MPMMLSALAVVLCAWRAFASRRTGFALDVAIVATAILAWHARAAGLPLELHWWCMPLYLLAATAIFAVSVALTTSNRLRYFSRGMSLRMQSARRMVGPGLLAPLHEELVWRVSLQSSISAALGPLAALVIVAAGFAAWHRTEVLDDARRAVEFCLFSLTLGAVFAFTHDPIFVFTIHFVRNFLILSIQPENVSA